MQRRRHFRIADSITPDHVVGLGDRNRDIDAAAFTIIDLSGGGLLARAASDSRIAEGEELRLAFHLDGEPVEVDALVAWVRPLAETGGVELGCRFEALSSRVQIAILDHIRRHHVSATG